MHFSFQRFVPTEIRSLLFLYVERRPTRRKKGQKQSRLPPIANSLDHFLFVSSDDCCWSSQDSCNPDAMEEDLSLSIFELPDLIGK